MENGVGISRVPEDISEEVRQDLTRSGLPTQLSRVRFDDTPVFIEPTRKVDDYDIIQDIKDQKANVTIGQLLHDNANYQKLIREAWIKRRKRRLKLPSMAVNFSQVEDYGAPELTVEIDGCSVPKVPVDGGSGVNLMLEDTAFDLGYTSFEATDQILRMVDQSRVIPVGRLSQVPILIGEVTYLLNYVIIRVSAGRPFPILLGRPWLYTAEVLVDWGAREFAFGKPRIRIPWRTEEYLGETSKTDGYTTDWSDPDEESTSVSYFVEQFAEVTETDFNFLVPITELLKPNPVILPNEDTGLRQGHIEDRSLGQIDVPLCSKWIQQQMKEGELPPVGVREGSDHPWSEIRVQPEEQEPDRIKNIVNPSDYEKVEVSPEKIFYLGKAMSTKERKAYVTLLGEYSDVFA